MILDSDVVIEFLRGNERTRAWLYAVRRTPERLWCSPVTRAEVRAGARSRELARAKALLDSLETLIIDGATGDIAGAQLAQYAPSHSLELGDALIAASALQSDDTLATFNRKHFPGVTRLADPRR
jgi:predicted nucleic acid-binding protein